MAFVDDEDYDTLSKYNWSIDRSFSGSDYAVTRINKKLVKMHRLIMGCISGDGLMIDHKDGDGLNNQKYNLRLADKSQNGSNRKTIRGESRFLGVSKQQTKIKYRSKKTGEEKVFTYNGWAAKITTQQRKIFIGLFKLEEDAAIAYNEAAKKYHGEFARLNVIG